MALNAHSPRLTQYYRPVLASTLDEDFDDPIDELKICENLRLHGRFTADAFAIVSQLSDPAECWSDGCPITAFHKPAADLRPHQGNTALAERLQNEYDEQQRQRQLERERIADLEWQQSDIPWGAIGIAVAQLGIELTKPIEQYPLDELHGYVKQYLSLKGLI